MNSHPSGLFRWIFPPPVIGLAWIFIISMLDWWSGHELSFSIYYLPGIVLVAWLSNRRMALIIAFCTAVGWLLPELATKRTYTHPDIPYWNAFMRMCFYVITVLLISEAKSRQQAEAELAAQDSILRSILDSMGDAVVVINNTGIVIVFNRAAEKIFGNNPIGRDAMRWVAELESSQYDEFSTKSQRPSPIRIAASGNLTGSREFYLRPDDEASGRVLGLTSQSLVGKDGKPTGVVMVISNLTARRAIEKQIAEATEREQCRMGQDLHDGVCQHLVSVAFAAGTLQNRLENLSLKAEATEAGKIATLINEAITEARNLAHGLYPAGLVDGVEIALQTLAATTKERTGIECVARIDRELPALDPVSTVHLYRITQEAISNASRHGMANFIEISLHVDGQYLNLNVTDTGKGMDEASLASRGMGLKLMRYRTNLMGGVFDIDSTPGQGTRITCTIRPTGKTSLIYEQLGTNGGRQT